jgi:hypothetical protein
MGGGDHVTLGNPWRLGCGRCRDERQQACEDSTDQHQAAHAGASDFVSLVYGNRCLRKIT